MSLRDRDTITATVENVIETSEEIYVRMVSRRGRLKLDEASMVFKKVDFRTKKGEVDYDRIARAVRIKLDDMLEAGEKVDRGHKLLNMSSARRLEGGER